MKRVPEGPRRVCVVLGGLLAFAWLVWVAAETEGFSHVQAKGWALLVIVSLAAFFAPFLVYRVIAWVREGFSTNTQSR